MYEHETTKRTNKVSISHSAGSCTKGKGSVMGKVWVLSTYFMNLYIFFYNLLMYVYFVN